MNTNIKLHSLILKLLKKLFFFSIPLFSIFTFTIAILFISGETANIDKVVSFQSKSRNPVTFGQAYSYQPKYYKLKMTKSLKPDILVLGSSRAMQFKSYMFHDSLNVYNAGGAINKIRHLNVFINKIPVNDWPKQIILSIDPWWFNEKWDNLKTNQADYDFDKQINPIRIILNSWQNVIEDLWLSKIEIRSLFENDYNVGLSAKMKNAGFQNDGSYDYGFTDYTINLKQRSTDDILECENFTGRFLPCKEINPKAVLEIKTFIQHCKLEGIDLTGLIAPFPSFINDHIRKNKTDYENFISLTEELSLIFEENDSRLFNFMALSENKNENELFVDGVHGSPKIYSEIVSILSNQNNESKQ